ncbi:hypothetical protein BOTBODRAFT_42084 [Botryobasidium botryosum FD-172 SS1]|uniref:DUF1857-domain-containing protein n=1 Tax=Botryobasidium botryosum (strain FD-172 SS1) TaxID=930990 RepID=A0A067MUF5_BOTB1|nr:hypothetical protein BOTBODRAFT_42084 [Botryobasidium botryosum FD-172 SS1]
MRAVTRTFLVNPPTESVKLSARQVYNGLVAKARDERGFVPLVEDCELLEETETGLLRRTTYKVDENSPGGVAKRPPSLEKVEFYPPTSVDYVIVAPDGGPPLARGYNIVSTGEQGELLITFMLAFGRNGPEDTGPEAEEKAQNLFEALGRGMTTTLKLMRQLAQDGKL